MRALPTMMIRLLAPFAPLFSKRVFEHVRVLVVGAILAPGRRTVNSALRAMGLDQHKQFHRYHRVFSRAAWSSREASHVLLGSLMKTFVPEGPLVSGVDETLERRQGKKIAAKGIYRDPVRSSHSHFIKASALRWVCVSLLAEIPWAFRRGRAAHPARTRRRLPGCRCWSASGQPRETCSRLLAPAARGAYQLIAERATQRRRVTLA